MEVEHGSEEFDRNKLLEIFPEELWKQILDRILEPEDAENCSNATSTFRALLEPRKNAFLFPKVLKILDSKNYLDFNHSKGILQCRLVCKSWKTAINKLLEIRPYHSQCIGHIPNSSELDQNQNDIVRNCIFRLYGFSLQDLEINIMPEMKNPHYQSYCPFPSRHVEINEEFMHSEPNDQGIIQPIPFGQYRQQTTIFLQLVGHHFWHANINLGPIDQESSWGWCRLLCSYLELMPNLKSLYILCPSNYMDEEGHGMDIEIRAFPALDYLRLLRMDMVPCFIVEQILTMIIVYKILEVGRRHPWAFPMRMITSPEQLSIPILYTEEFQYLRPSWKLKVLKLYISSTANTLTWSTVIERLENYGDTLVDLELSLPEQEDVQNVWETSKRPFCLQNLKRLKITTNNVCSLDFLLGLQNLEYLHLVFVNVNIGSVSEDNNRRDLQINYFDTGLDAFIESNIWEVMPILRKVTMADGYRSPQRTFMRK